MISKKQIPNALTISRLALAGLFIFLLIITAILGATDVSKTAFTVIHYLLLVIFIIAMVTDYLDGYLARKWNVVSTFGKIFDPIADKIITTSMLIYLTNVVYNTYFIIIVILLILRDIVVDGTRIYAASRNVTVQANILGKIKTIMMSISLIILALFAPIIHSTQNGLEHLQIYLFIISMPIIATLIISYVSGGIYIRKYLSK